MPPSNGLIRPTSFQGPTMITFWSIFAMFVNWNGFWVDPASPYYKDVFAQDDKTYLLYCQSAWRSALASKALHDMGMTNVKHLTGGFKGWKEAGGTIVERPHKKK